MFELLFVVIVLGLLAWLVQSLPIPVPFRTAAFIVLLLILLIYVAQLFGVVTPWRLRAL